jgi:hypothetical protein
MTPQTHECSDRDEEALYKVLAVLGIKPQGVVRITVDNAGYVVVRNCKLQDTKTEEV